MVAAINCTAQKERGGRTIKPNSEEQCSPVRITNHTIQQTQKQPLNGGKMKDVPPSRKENRSKNVRQPWLEKKER